jgi:hypothetical protein
VSKPKPISNNANDAAARLPTAWRWLISVLVIIHFSGIALTYAANWRRSELQDQWLQRMQPYLIGGNWYHEMLPIEWYGDTAKSQHTWLEAQRSGSTEWTRVLDNVAQTNPQQQRLLRLTLDLVEQENNDGLSRVMLSIISHIELANATSSPSNQVARIRIVQPPNKLDKEGKDTIVFEGDVARFESGEIGFIPKLESHRTVKAIKPEKGAP